MSKPRIKKPTLFEQILQAKNNISKFLQGASNTYNKSKVKGVADLLNLKGIVTRQSNLRAQTGKYLQKTPDTTAKITKQPKGMQMGTVQVGPLKLPVSELGAKAVPFLTSLPGEIARSYGKTEERLNTPGGQRQISQGARDIVTKTIPSILKNPKNPKNYLDVLGNPSVQTALDVSDVATLGIGSMGARQLLKKSGKKKIKELEPAVKNVTGKLASNDVYLVDEFLTWVKQNGGGRSDESMKMIDPKTLADVRAMSNEVFGKKAMETWSNKKLANAWDYVFNRLIEGKRVPIGLEVDDVSKNFAKSNTQTENLPQTHGQVLGETLPPGSTATVQQTLPTDLANANISPSMTPNTSITNNVNTNFDEVANRIAKQVNPKIKKTPVSDFMENVRGAGGVLKEKLVDSFSPIEDYLNKLEKTTKTKLNPTSDPRLLRNRVLGAEGIGKQMLKKNVEPVLKQVGVKNLDEFDRYLAARHALDVNGRGIETGIDSLDAKIFTDSLSGKYEESAKAVTKHTQDVLRYIKEAGVISQAVYDDLLTKYPNYVPLNRVFDDIEGVVRTPNKSVGSLSKQTVVQKLKGSKREINSPIENIINKTMQAVDQAERNRVAQGIVGLRNISGMEDVIKEVPVGTGKHTISVFENGQKKIYEVPEEFERAAKNLDKAHMDILTQVASFPVRVARLGITGINLPFIATNVVRDQLFSIITSTKAGKTSIAHPYNFIKAFLDTAGSKGAYDDFLASGGGSSNFYSVGRGAQKNYIKDLARSKSSRIAHTITDPRKWLSTLEDAVGVSEQTTRTQQFLGNRGTKGRIDPFASPTDETLRAVQAGRENTVDFGKKGAYGQVLNSVFIYLNAGIQGTRTTFRTFKKNPVATSLKLAGTVYTPIAATTLWNNATPERQEAYKDIPDYEKQGNIIILPPNPVKDENGRYPGSIKIPLPQGFSALAIPVRSAIEHLAGSGTDSVQDVLLNTLGKAGPVDFSSPNEVAARVLPTAIGPAVENFTNTKFFTGGPIVPRNKQDLEPGLQSGTDTTQTIKFIGEKFNISPAKIENLVRGYSGDVGIQVLNAVDQLMAKAGIIEESQVGGTSILENIMKRFTKTAGGKLDEQNFQDLQKIVQEEATKKFKIKEEAKLILNKISEDPNYIRHYSGQGKFTPEMQEEIKKIIEEETNDLSGQEKYLKSQSNDVKARFILDKVKAMEPEDVGQYIIDLKERKVISENVEEQIMEMIMSEKPQSSIIKGDSAPITQAFGNWNPEIEIFSGGVNTGTDFGINEDTELSLPDGVWEVIDAYDGDDMNSGYGRSILVENRKTGERIRLSHLNEVLADKGEMLRGGSTIGYSGNTGNSTGPHLDVEFFDADGNLADILRSKYASSV